MMQNWQSQFDRPRYKGRNFLPLKKGGLTLAPSHLNGGPWVGALRKSKQYSNSLTARFVRAVLDHSPIGSYRLRFNLADEYGCSCGARLEYRGHILFSCRKYTRTAARPAGDTGVDLRAFIRFLEWNPIAFSFGGDSILSHND